MFTLLTLALIAILVGVVAWPYLRKKFGKKTVVVTTGAVGGAPRGPDTNQQ